MSTISLRSFERHNIIAESGRLSTRRGFVVSLAATSLGLANNVFVGGFSVLVPSSSETEHYLFLQDTTTGVVTMIVTNEEWIERYRLGLGVHPSSPVFSHALVNNQLMINAPSMSGPLYGLPGGGVMPAVATASENPDTTAIDVPSGHICSFGDRMPVAQGSVVLFNDPGLDPRTYTGQNVIALPATIHAITQGPDGALWMLTPAGAYSMAADALGQGQSVAGFISLIPQVLTSRPGGACSTPYGVVALTTDGVAVLSGGSSRELAFSTYQGRRKLTRPIDVLDVRQFGRVYPTSFGVLVGFGTDRDYAVAVDLGEGTTSFWYTGAASTPLNVVGVLRTRDGEDLVIDRSGVYALHTKGLRDFSDSAANDVSGALCGRVQSGPRDNPLIRRVTLSAANGGAPVSVCGNGVVDTGKSTTVNGDTVIGTDLWGTPNWASLTARSVRGSLNVRATELDLEVTMGGMGRILLESVDIEAGGTWTNKKETQT
jgi:hypothetical protein